MKSYPVIELVETRDQRLVGTGGRWFGNYETPCILSRKGWAKKTNGQALDTTAYGRKESEGKDFNEDTNFGKLKRIPHPQLQAFLQKCLAMGVGQVPSLLEKEGEDKGLLEPEHIAETQNKKD